MANKDAAFGLRPIGKVGQNADNQGMSQYEIADNSSTSIFQGDLVKMVTSGFIDKADADNVSLGVFWGTFISKDPSTGKPKFSNFYTQTDVGNGETIEAFVYDDPYARFEIQSSADTERSDVGMNADISYVAGSTINGVSKVELDDTSFVTTTAQLRLIGFSKDIENNEVGVDNVNCVVTINEHFLKSTTGI
jgi:hypothetical protein